MMRWNCFRSAIINAKWLTRTSLFGAGVVTATALTYAGTDAHKNHTNWELKRMSNKPNIQLQTVLADNDQDDGHPPEPNPDNITTDQGQSSGFEWIQTATKSATDALANSFNIIGGAGGKSAHGIRIAFCDEKTQDTTFKEDQIVRIMPDKIINAGKDEAGRLWDGIITEVYKYLSKQGKHDLETQLPVIGFIDRANDGSYCVMNSARMAQHFIDTYKLHTAYDNENKTFDWNEIPPLIVTMIKSHDKEQKIPINIDDRKFYQETLTGAGNCVSLLGYTGTGKSSLANAMLGLNPDTGPFPTSNGSRSCTHAVDVCSGYERGDSGSGQLLTVIDSPGMGDSEGRDDTLLEKLFEYFSALYYGPNVFVLTKEFTNPRLNRNEKVAITILGEMFGKDLPNHLIVALTKCDSNNKNGPRGWAQHLEQRKKELCEDLTGLIGKQPLDIIPVCCDDAHTLMPVFDIIRKNSIGRYSSSQVKRYRDVKEEKQRKQMQEQLEQKIESLKKHFETKHALLEKDLQWEKEQRRKLENEKRELQREANKSWIERLFGR